MGTKENAIPDGWTLVRLSDYSITHLRWLLDRNLKSGVDFNTHYCEVKVGSKWLHGVKEIQYDCYQEFWFKDSDYALMFRLAWTD